MWSKNVDNSGEKTDLSYYPENTQPFCAILGSGRAGFFVK